MYCHVKSMVVVRATCDAGTEPIFQERSELWMEKENFPQVMELESKWDWTIA